MVTKNRVFRVLWANGKLKMCSCRIKNMFWQIYNTSMPKQTIFNFHYSVPFLFQTYQFKKQSIVPGQICTLKFNRPFVLVAASDTTPKSSLMIVNSPAWQTCFITRWGERRLLLWDVIFTGVPRRKIARLRAHLATIFSGLIIGNIKRSQISAFWF